MTIAPEPAPPARPKRVRPLVAWPGGKSRMLEHLLPLISSDARVYCEVFGGGAAVLLAKPRHKVEVVNDINGDLVALMRNAQRHPEALLEALSWATVSRQDFFDRKAQPGATEIERAASFLLRCRSSFGGGQKPFAVSKTNRVGIDRQQLAARIEEWHRRTDRVVIENLPWQRMLRNYDSAATFFFLDPPYVGESTDAYDGFSQSEMAALRAALAGLKGRWLVTVNDSPANRELFTGCRIQGVQTPNTLSKNFGGQRKSFGELIITPT